MRKLNKSDKGKKVFVYFNLHRHVWSIKCLKSGLVIGHAKAVELENCVLKVSEAGRQRVIKEGRKNVHAGVVGILKAWNGASKDNFIDLTASQGINPELVTYNPYKYETFVLSNNRDVQVLEADHVFLAAKGRKVWAS